MGEFLTGVTEKYPKELLKGRIEIEGNVVSCLMKDMLLIDEAHLSRDNFITKDGSFYFSLIKAIRKKGFYSLDEVTILSNLSQEIIDKYDEMGGWETIQHQIDIININNFDTYIDILFRENIILNMHDDGFNLLKDIDIDGKKIKPLRLFKKMTAEEVTDWYESRLAGYGTGYSSKVLEEEELDFDDEFIESCNEGLENGVPFGEAGDDVNLETINCFPFLSNRVNGFLPGTFNVMAGYSSSGKSTWWITILMGLLEQDRKILIISNEESIKKYKIKFIVWLLAKYERYYGLSKKKLMAGNITKEDREHLKNVQEYWREKYKGKVKLVSIAEANMTLVKKKMRENVLRYGYDTILYDTLKLDFNTAGETRQDLALIKDSRDLDAFAKKYNVIMLASLQLAIHTIGKLWLDSSTLSTAKQSKETMESLFLMRNVYPQELDPKDRYYCHPFRLKKVNDKWVEEKYDCDPTATWRMIFLDKTRSGQNSSDNGVCFLSRFTGDFSVFKETCMCRPKHGQIL